MLDRKFQKWHVATLLKYGVGCKTMKSAEINGICHVFRDLTSRFKLDTKNDEVGCLKSDPIIQFMHFSIILRPTPYFKGVASVYFHLTWTPTHNPHYYRPAKSTPFPKWLWFLDSASNLLSFRIVFSLIWAIFEKL